MYNPYQFYRLQELDFLLYVNYIHANVQCDLFGPKMKFPNNLQRDLFGPKMKFPNNYVFEKTDVLLLFKLSKK